MSDRSELIEKIPGLSRISKELSLEISENSLAALRKGALRIRFINMGGAETLGQDSKVYIGASRGNIVIRLSRGPISIHIGNGVFGDFDFVCHGSSTVNIGDNTSSVDTKIFIKNSSLACGIDCMFSSEVLIQTSDQHGIIDLTTGESLPHVGQSIKIGDHVWLGRRTTLAPNSKVGSGSIVGTGAVVVGEIESNSIAVGVPARVVRENVSWSRQQNKIDNLAMEYFQSLHLPWCK